ncbi:hypothetical protein [Flagellimonas sp.]|uniref:hypothetical protein n=1 Tax=Flagellimonas sp. TaxID=2058762 RepID=UPI003B52A7F1
MKTFFLYVFSVLLLMLLGSCSTDAVNEIQDPDGQSGEEEPGNGDGPGDTTEQEGYLLYYMNYPLGINPPDLLKKVQIEYDAENRIVGRVGGIYDAQVDPAVGFKYSFSEKVVDEISHVDNTIIVERKSLDSEIMVPAFKSTFILDEEDKIIQKIIEDSELNTKDTLDFEYDPLGRIQRLVSRDMLLQKEVVFYFNAVSNLDSIVTREYDVEEDESTITKEEFGDYDFTENPLGHLNLFEETFTRSLSRNNYTHYFICQWKPSSGSCWERRWTLKNDDSGRVRFDQF